MSDFETSFPFTWFRSPLSGDVIQNISPEFTSVDIAGNARIERRIVQEVASYGDQLGTMLDVLMLLSKSLEQSSPEVKALEDLVKKVNRIKSQEKTSAADRARDALKTLKSTDPSAFRDVLRELGSQNQSSD